ncbi:hypothetical protein EGJ52_01325 [Pseudomonas luteola]|uniref:Lipoprotein n=2 Tax=Pseudomonas luteola TaxID=47886 RepID=A0A2X2CBA8_PSELU|nr:hypothetical protein [Pseudomonas sp.]AYN95790.1 hypothetical protein EAW52_18415 [Pseudomonas sp. LTJR-52]ENA33090.1 hypothetical protein HMPREF1487_06824 [Pseudomonas sp. HPB0071]RRW47957.1 hypothetical protein EGJ52_01325 [Pseudomonas luteola]SHI60786.1 hypothetical protein SAMN05216295_102487 [Pseudomonas zeshuii]SPZ02956.1 Uncharacterised protein [Pseudomonas luteola]
MLLREMGTAMKSFLLMLFTSVLLAGCGSHDDFEGKWKSLNAGQVKLQIAPEEVAWRVTVTGDALSPQTYGATLVDEGLRVDMPPTSEVWTIDDNGHLKGLGQEFIRE